MEGYSFALWRFHSVSLSTLEKVRSCRDAKMANRYMFRPLAVYGYEPALSRFRISVAILSI